MQTKTKPFEEIIDSGDLEYETCPKCNQVDSMSVISHMKPFRIEKAECLECGFGYATKPSSLTLKQVNEQRSILGMKPLKQLRRQVKGWYPR